MKSYYLSIDLGAASGRTIVTVKDGPSIRLDEIYRFKNNPHKKDNTLYWDFNYILENVFESIRLAFAK